MKANVFSHGFKLLRHYINVKQYHASQVCQSKVKIVAHLLPEVEAQLEAGKFKHRKHPGIRKTTCVELPENLFHIIHKVIEDKAIGDLKEKKKDMANYLYSRRLPIEQNELNQKTLDAMRKMNIPEDVLFNNDAESQRLMQKVKYKLQGEVKRWKPIEYNFHTCMVYLVTRFMENYACVYQVLSEIGKLIPSFQPKTYFDFGSGVGSSLWAANHFWGSSIEEQFCVDASADMNSLCELLLRGGNIDDPMLLKNVYFRQFLPVSGERKYDLVVSAFSLMDLPSVEERLKVVDVLWQKTNDILVFVENGSNSGFFSILEARDYILTLEKLSGNQSQGVQIIAPCSHHMVCPKYGASRFPCHFKTQFHPFWPQKDRHAIRQDYYSYVILRKGHEQISTEKWPRIVEPVTKRARFARCRMCCSDGKIHEVIFSKGKYPKNTFWCARNCELGDLMPVSLSEKVVKDYDEDDGSLEDGSNLEEENEDKPVQPSQ